MELASVADKKWYIVHTYSGQEKRAKQALLERANSLGFADDFDEVLIPEENVVEIVGGQKRTSKRKFFPGYIMVHMHLNDETWHVVKNTPKVTGFVGAGQKPAPLTDEEVEQVIHQVTVAAAEKPKPKYTFESGEAVRIIDGPFSNFSGVVDEVNSDRNTLKVMVTIFGRATPVELDFLQVEKT